MVLQLSRERNLEITNISYLGAIHMSSVTLCNHSLTVIPQSLPLVRPASQPTSHSLTHSMTVTLCHTQSLPLAQPASHSFTTVTRSFARSLTHSLADCHSLSLAVIHLSFFTKLFRIAYCLFRRPFCIREAVVPFSARPTVIVPNRGFSH